MTSGCRARHDMRPPPGAGAPGIIIEPDELVLCDSDISSRVILHPPGYQTHNLCRQIEDEDDTHLSDETWGAQLLVEGAGNSSVGEQLSEDERNLAAAFVNFVRQPMIHDLGNIEKDVNGELIDVTSYEGLPPLPLLKRNQNPIWYHQKMYRNELPIIQQEECEAEINNSPLIHNRHQQSKKSLPHKKRISRKLKRNSVHNSQIVQDHDETNDVPQTLEIIQENVSTDFHSNNEHNTLASTGIVDGVVHVDRTMFMCQLCGEYYGDDQLKFFYHLKQHYEPSHHNTSIILESMHHDGNSISMDKIEDTMGVGNEPLPDSLVDLSLEDAVSNKSLLYESQDKISEYDNEKSIFNSSLKSPIYTADDKSILSSNKTIYFSGTVEKFIQKSCTQCPKTKRLKQFDSQDKEIHTSKMEEMSEFSEPEDLMEGIHVVVENENDYLEEDLSSQHSNTIIIHSLENQDQYILPHLTIENGQMVQQPNLPSKEWFVKEESNENVAIITKTVPIEENHSSDNNIDDETKSESINSDELVVCPLCGSIFSCRKDYEEHTQQLHMNLKEEELERMMTVEVDVSDTEPGEIVPFNEIDIDDDSEGIEELELPEKVKKTPKKTKNRILKCIKCERQFKHKNSMIYHMLSHNGTRSFQCDICSKTFVTAGALKVHSRLHSGDRPYKCVECNRKFRQWGDLKYHFISIHSNLRQHQCEFCGKNFARKYSLIIHRRIHTGEKSYRCDFCDKTFRASSYLQSHRKIHTGEKPYPCGLCGKRFRMKGDMRRHLRIHNVKQSSENETLSKISNLKELSISSKKIPKPSSPVKADANEEDVQKEESRVENDNENSNSEVKQAIEVKQMIYSTQIETVLQGTKINQPISMDSNSAMYVWPMYIA